MKKLIFAALMLFCASTVVLATEKSDEKEVAVSYVIRSSFEKSFGEVKEVKWKFIKASNLYKASFTLNDETMSAFFNVNGDLVAQSSPRLLEQLPVALRVEMGRQFPNVALQNLFELQTDDETAYYFQVTQQHKTQLYKAFANGAIRKVDGL